MSQRERLLGRLYRNWQDRSGGYGGWHGWKEVFPAMSFVTIAERSGPYRFVLQAFGLGPNGKLVHSRMESDGTWNGWVPFLRSRPFRFIEAKYGATGHLELFGIGDDDGILYHNWQNSDNEDWHDWVANFQDAPKLQCVTAALGTTGNLEVFGIGLDGTLYHSWQTEDRWYTWGRDFQGAPRVSAVVAVTGATGHLEVFAVGADDGTLYHNWLDGDGWKQWTPDFQGAPKVDSLAAALGSGPNLHVFAIARDDNSIAHLRQDGGRWYSWETDFLGGARARAVTAVEGPHAQLEVFAIGTDHALLRTWQEAPAGPYDGWHPWERHFQGAPPADFVTAALGGGTAGTEGPHLEVFLISPRLDP